MSKPLHLLSFATTPLSPSAARLTNQHLIQDGPQAPPVALHAVPLLQQHLGRDVVGGAHRGIGQAAAVALPVRQLLRLGVGWGVCLTVVGWGGEEEAGRVRDGFGRTRDDEVRKEQQGWRPLLSTTLHTNPCCDPCLAAMLPLHGALFLHSLSPTCVLLLLGVHCPPPLSKHHACKPP